MKRSNRLLILLGLLIAIGGALGAIAIASSGGGGTGPGAVATATSGPSVQVVVASTKISAGTVIDKTMVKTESRKVADLSGVDSTFSSVNDVIGRIASVDIPQAHVIVGSSDLLTAGSAVDGQSIKDSIDKGFDAISMELDQNNGVGTLVVPGDRVDIILTTYITQLAISKSTAAGTQYSTGGSALTSKLILQNCKILRTLLPPVADTSNTGAQASAAVAAVPSSATVQFTDRHMIAIVEVTPEQAELIRWAQRTEQTSPETYIDLAFALRSSQDDNTDPVANNPYTSVPGLTFSEIVSKYGVLPPDPTGTLPNSLGSTVRW